MLDSLKKPLSLRFLRMLVLMFVSFLLLPVSGWFMLALAPLAIHVIVGFRLTTRRDVVRALSSPSLLILPLCLAFWIRSHQVMSFALVATDVSEFVGGYIFPGVIEIGLYQHDPAGLKYMALGVTPEIADVMTDDVRRFQKFEGSSQVFDCFCIVPMNCRKVPVVQGGAFGTIYAGLSRTPGPFYLHSGPWSWASAYRTHHVGFHILIPGSVAALFFVMGVRRWRRHERRLRTGECIGCGYNLTGNESGICSECGRGIDATHSPVPHSLPTGKWWGRDGNE